ncbi:MAG: aminotransferase class V-fold PLP-dependent enzyme [Caldilineaceae bacterium]|nr:aminotransferase class V-fold PLP-dependent enzyme [Caldilineaceae bacterium]
MTDLRAYFQLDPEIVFLNHGSFGATPKPVFAAYQEWQRRLERQPVDFFQRQLVKELRLAREALAAYVHAAPEDLVFVHNATFGVNLVARSLALQPGDEILATNHEYGACSNAWELACRKSGARYIRQHISLPVTTPAAIVDAFWQGVTPYTRVIYLSHITSPTALTLPVAEICARARDANILTVVDGAHAPGQIPVDLAALGADIYTGNLHKWLCAPKGAGFLWARKEMQAWLEPLVVSWGYGPERTHFEETDFVSAMQWQGTLDFSAYLSVPAAIEFQHQHGWDAVREHCHRLLRATLEEIGDITGQPAAYPHDGGFYQQMAIAPIPFQDDLPGLKQRLYNEHRIEVPCTAWDGHHFIRISVQGYNTEADLARLVDALRTLLA